MALNIIRVVHGLRIAVGITMMTILLLAGCGQALWNDVAAHNALASADDVSLETVGHFGGVTYAAAVSGNYAYLGIDKDEMRL